MTSSRSRASESVESKWWRAPRTVTERTDGEPATSAASCGLIRAETVRPLTRARIDDADPSATTRPRSTSTTRSANWSASSM